MMLRTLDITAFKEALSRIKPCTNAYPTLNEYLATVLLPAIESGQAPSLDMVEFDSFCTDDIIATANYYEQRAKDESQRIGLVNNIRRTRPHIVTSGRAFC